jgi:hypothetical protein
MVEKKRGGKVNIDLFPRWRSHKEVSAAKIVQVFSDGLMELDVNDPNTGLLMVVAPADKMFSRYRPIEGDYYVVYDDGYASISPRAAFLEGYHPVEEGENK